MKKKLKLFAATLTTVAFSLGSRVVFAIADPDNPSLREITHPFFRVLNVMIVSSGAFFVIFLFVAAFKFAMAQGDPKAIQGAKETVTYAIYGFLVAVGAYLILSIVAGALGAEFSSPADAMGAIEDSMQGILDLIWYND